MGVSVSSDVTSEQISQILHDIRVVQPTVVRKPPDVLQTTFDSLEVMRYVFRNCFCGLFDFRLPQQDKYNRNYKLSEEEQEQFKEAIQECLATKCEPKNDHAGVLSVFWTYADWNCGISVSCCPYGSVVHPTLVVIDREKTKLWFIDPEEYPALASAIKGCPVTGYTTHVVQTSGKTLQSAFHYKSQVPITPFLCFLFLRFGVRDPLPVIQSLKEHVYALNNDQRLQLCQQLIEWQKRVTGLVKRLTSSRMTTSTWFYLRAFKVFGLIVLDPVRPCSVCHTPLFA